jgi:hypothetical protein
MIGSDPSTCLTQEVSVIKYVPGFVAAIIAFVVLKLVSWMDSTALQAFIFLAAYGVVVVGIEKGMKRYGAGKP